MKFGFVTCVQLGLSCIDAIYEVSGSLDVVVTLNDDKAVGKSGRVFLDDVCAQRGIKLLKVDHINDGAVIECASSLDWLFVIGWSQIANPEMLNSATKGVLGMHPTLLPKGRGRASIPWAILKRLEKTGVTMFKLDEGVDTGPVVAQLEIPLTSEINATELYGRVNRAQVDLMKDVFPRLQREEIVLQEQDHSAATVWPRREPRDGKIDFKGSVHDAERLVRAVCRPYPGAFYIDVLGRKIIVWSATVSETKDAESCLEFYDGYLVPLETEVAGRDKGKQ